MNQLYSDYCWINGVPVGKGGSAEPFSGTSYKVVCDPYRKRISLEKYQKNQFCEVIYDSILLDFRHLRQHDFNAWRKIPVAESPQESKMLILSQDDRVLFWETCLFQEDLCRECRIHSAHGLFLSVHKMFYSQFNDPFDGVILYDSRQHPVMFKRYEFDTACRQFTHLLEEQWDMQIPPPVGG